MPFYSSNLSNLTNILKEKDIKLFNARCVNSLSNKEDNFVYNLMRKMENENKEQLPPPMLNKGFIMDDMKIEKEKQEKIQKLNEKMNSIIKSHDNLSIMYSCILKIGKLMTQLMQAQLIIL
jgi:LEA14-like dessication related protein